MQKNCIKTQRLCLREITENDANRIVYWRKNPEVYKYFRAPHELTYEEHMKWYTENYLMDTLQLQFIAGEKSSQKEIGIFSVRKCLNIEDCVEVSYLVDESEQGKGYAKEAVLGMIKFAQEKWKAKKVIAEIHKDNVPSQKMIEKLEFELVNKKDNFWVYERLLCYT